MAATERMREYAITIACVLELPFPNFLNYTETGDFISAHVDAYKATPSRIKAEKKAEINSWKYAVFDLEESKLNFYIGQWVGDCFYRKRPPFDSLENINSTDRVDLAQQFWACRLEDASGWKHVKYLNGKPITYDELIPIIARDLDYRIPKAAAKYLFKKTGRAAAAVAIDPSIAPYNTVRLQYEETFHRLYKESHTYQHGKREFREWVDGDSE